MADDASPPEGAEEVTEESPATEAPETTEPEAAEEVIAEAAPEEAAVGPAEVIAAEEAEPIAAPDAAEEAEAPTPPHRPFRTDGRPVAIATGRRKSSRARVRMYDGTGRFILNGRGLESYVPSLANRIKINEPLRVSGMEGRFDIHAKLEGGGSTGQTGALQLGIARALVEVNPELRPELKKAGLLTRDARRVERKKYGLRKARRAPQFTKR